MSDLPAFSVTGQPVAQRITHFHQRPNGAIEDPYDWLRDRSNADTLAYLEAENQHTEAWFAPQSELVEQLFQEIKSRIQETDESVPTFKDGWWYVSQTREGLDYPIHYRGLSRDHATTTPLLDENQLAKGHEYFALGAFDISPDSQLLAWSGDVDGSEHYTLRIRNVETGEDLSDLITDTAAAGTAWSSDSASIFYLTSDDQERPSTVWRHVLGTPADQDKKVYFEPDERFHLSVDLTRSGDWIIIEANSKTSSETWLISASRPADEPLCVRQRQTDVEYHIDHWGDCFIVLTNDEAPDFKLMTAPQDVPSNWTELLGHESGRRISRVDCFANHLIIQDWANAQPRLRIMTKEGSLTDIHVDDVPHDVEIDSNPEWTTSVVRYDTESLVSPPSVWESDITSGSRTLLKRTPTPNVDLEKYETTRHWAPSSDGARVPYDVIRLRNPLSAAPAPTMVYAYGSYDISLPPWFSVARLSLVDRGWTWVLAHPRGGGELGRHWYFDGRLLNKRHTFEDVNAVAAHLVETGIADAGRLAVRGGSAGGLMVGACLNLAPELWKAAVAEVPFVDVVTTMSDPSQPLTVTEWEEWGDPRVEPYASYMASYSPYDNLTARSYPAILATAGLNDPRVSYHEPAKWIAKIRALRTNNQPLLLRTEMGAGHGGPSGRYDRWREEARILAFVLACV